MCSMTSQLLSSSENWSKLWCGIFCPPRRSPSTRTILTRDQGGRCRSQRAGNSWFAYTGYFVSIYSGIPSLRSWLADSLAFSPWFPAAKVSQRSQYEPPPAPAYLVTGLPAAAPLAPLSPPEVLWTGLVQYTDQKMLKTNKSQIQIFLQGVPPKKGISIQSSV